MSQIDLHKAWRNPERKTIINTRSIQSDGIVYLVFCVLDWTEVNTVSIIISDFSCFFMMVDVEYNNSKWHLVKPCDAL